MYGTMIVGLEDWDGLECFDYTTEGRYVLNGTTLIPKNTCQHSKCKNK